MQEQAPSQLHESVHGGMAALGECLELVRYLAGQLHGPGPMSLAPLARHAIDHQWCWRLRIGKLRPPVVGGRAPVLRLQPGNVIRKWRGSRQRGLVAAQQGLVDGHHVAIDKRCRPAIKQHVVRTPQDPEAVVGQPEQADAQHRCAGRVKADRFVPLAGIFEVPGLLLFGQRAKIHFNPGNHRIGNDKLVQLLAFANEDGAKDIVPFNHRPPGLPEQVRVQVAGEGRVYLRYIRTCIEHAVIQHALLHRGGGIQVLDGVSGLPRIQIGSGDARHREVAGQQARLATQGNRRRSLGGCAMLDDPPQCVFEVARQALHVRPQELLIAEAQFELELAQHHHAVELQDLLAAALGVDIRARRLWRESEQRSFVERLVELAQVVEHHLRLTPLLGLCKHSVAGEVPQDTVAEALVRNGPVVFLDAADHARDLHVIASKRQRVGGSEPAHRLRGVQCLEHIFPTVSLEDDAQGRRLGPTAHAKVHRREQQLIDVGAVRCRALAQEPGRFRFRQPDANGPSGAAPGGGPHREVRREGRNRIGQLRVPERPLLLQGFRPGIVCQRGPPLLERRRLGCQSRRWAALLHAICLLQVRKEDAPGDAIDDQMVSDQQEPARVGTLEIHDTQQGWPTDPECKLVVFTSLRDAHPVYIRRQHFMQAAIIDHLVRQRLVRRRPVIPLAFEAQPECIVSLKDGADSPFQGVEVEGRRRHKQHTLVEMLDVLPVGGKKCLLDRQELQSTFDRLLRRVCSRGDPFAANCQLGDRLAREELPGRQRDAGLVGACNHLDGENGVAAQLEEIIVYSDFVYAQKRLPYLTQQRFCRVTWTCAAIMGGSRHLELRQALLIQFAAGIERQP
ncbi:hypothetical protein D3C71_810810 [compost metagenome]